MKKAINYILIILASFFLVSCQKSSTNIEAYAVVHYETDFLSGTTGRIIFGERYNSNGKQSTVYHINEKKKLIQIQPKRIGNTIINYNASWVDLGKFETIGTDTVYYFDNDLMNRYKKINDEDINIYKITIIHELSSVIMINEIFVIKVNDITAFEFVYKIEDFE